MCGVQKVDWTGDLIRNDWCRWDGPGGLFVPLAIVPAISATTGVGGGDHSGEPCSKGV